MNEAELREFMAARTASPNVQRHEVEALHCYGCAHSSALDPPPGKPSGERPCCACVRNPDREAWAQDSRRARARSVRGAVVVDDRGNARTFDPYEGTAYNGMPMVHHPMDRYVTLDQRDQEDWIERNPEYGKAISFNDAGNPVVQ